MKPIVNYGLSDSLIDAVRKAVEEALVGGQKKLDVDKDGKLEKTDFASLRAKKDTVDTKPKLKEEDEQIDELSNKTYFAAYKAADRKTGSAAIDRDGGIKNKNLKTMELAYKGVKRNNAKQMGQQAEDIEQMDEISSELAGRASNARIDRNNSGGVSHTDLKKLRKGTTPLDQQSKTTAGYMKTLDRKNEEVEQMDEIKLADLPRRMVKGKSYGANYVDPEGADETAADMKKPEPKRKSGPQGTMKRRFNTKSYTKLRSQYK